MPPELDLEGFSAQVYYTMARGLILQPSYRVRGGVPVIRLFGRLDKGGPFLIEEDRFRPYFFLHARDLKKLPSRDGLTIEASRLVDLEGKKVARIAVATPPDVTRLRDRLEAAGAHPLEADLRFPYRYLIDLGVRAGIEIEAEPVAAERGLAYYHNPKIRPAEVEPRLDFLSLDIETMPDAGSILSFALAGSGVDEVYVVSAERVQGASVVDDEAALLRMLAQRIRAIDPDVIVGWNVVDFDLRVIAKRAEVLGIRLEFGRVPGEMIFQSDRHFTRQGRVEIPGRVVLDGIGLVRDAIRLPDYRLQTVAMSVLGKGKLIDHEAPDAAAEILRLYKEDREALAAYNLEDARLVNEILAHEGLLDLAIKRSQLSGMPLDRVGASVASFDRLYLPELRRRGFVAPSVRRDAESGRVAGGAVLDSVPGLFSNVAVFDFKSLYPSLIRTFSLDPLAFACAGEGAVEAPNGARFSRDTAILPDLLAEFIESREEAKGRGDRHADQAIKVMMNSLFGVLASPGCRFANPEIANAITGFGQQTLRWTRDAFEVAGVSVLYGDTDSVFVKLNIEYGQSPQEVAEELRQRIEGNIQERIRRDYGVEPKLILELEYILERFFLPRVRGGKGGSKKRYAGWRDGKLLVVGLEAVRRDWPELSRRVQRGLLERLFQNQEILPWLKEVIASVRAGEVDDELVYVKRLRKGDLSRYTKAVPPHVQAARKAGKDAGNVIRYIITATGPEPVLSGRPLPPGIDREHAIEKLLRPIADAILPEIHTSFDEALGQPVQLQLL
ncbi:MAG: DNA polymerase II [Deltaproteobacteria bacterium]